MTLGIPVLLFMKQGPALLFLQITLLKKLLSFQRVSVPD